MTKKSPAKTTRPGGDYDVSLNYRIKDELQHGETSTAGMVRGAILNADAQSVVPSAFHQTPKISTSHHQGDERRSKGVLLLIVEAYSIDVKKGV